MNQGAGQALRGLRVKSGDARSLRSGWDSIALFAALAIVVVLGGVGNAADDAGSGSKGKVTEQARSQANDLYENRCESCHGTEGHGDGPGAMALGKPPANFSNKRWQKTVTDRQIATAIVQGGAALGLSSEMQPNPDLAGQPMVVQALVMKVRQFGK
jgi:mono/diheme cytochrome c family protein